jgi:methylenetetrahydrofolate reductase (NADPH)
MHDNLFGISVPQPILDRLAAAGDERAEGLAICAELVAGLADIQGVAGAQFMAPAQPAQAIADAIRATGLR